MHLRRITLMLGWNDSAELVWRTDAVGDEVARALAPDRAWRELAAILPATAGDGSGVPAFLLQDLARMIGVGQPPDEIPAGVLRDELEEALRARRLLMLARLPGDRPRDLTRPPRARIARRPTTPEPPPPPRRPVGPAELPPTPEEVPADPLPPAWVDAVAQADSLIRAARTGAPFCEECARARARAQTAAQSQPRP